VTAEADLSDQGYVGTVEQDLCFRALRVGGEMGGNAATNQTEYVYTPRGPCGEGAEAPPVDPGRCNCTSHCDAYLPDRPGTLRRVCFETAEGACERIGESVGTIIGGVC
jgi:hypothetical protein